MSAERDAWERLITLRVLTPDSLYSPGRAKQGWYSATLKSELKRLQQAEQTQPPEHSSRRSAYHSPDRPDGPLTSSRAIHADPVQTLDSLKTEAQDLVKASPDRALWELRLLLKAKFPKVDNASIGAALQAAKSDDADDPDGYFPGDELPDPEVGWLLPDFIPAGDLTMLVATSKAGKTRFYLGLLAAMARQQSTFLCRTLPQLPPIVLIGSDMPRGMWRKYLQDCGLSSDGLVPSCIKRLFTLDRPLLLNADGFSRIKTLCQEHPGALVILDSLRSCTRNLGIDENSAEASDLLYQLGEVVTDGGGTALVAHHAPKGIIRDGSVGVAAIRGSSAIGGVPSQVISLHHLTKQHNGYPIALKDDQRRRVFIEGRFAEPLDLLVELQAQMGWELVGDYSEFERECAEEREQRRLTEGQERLLQLVQSATVTTEEAAQQLGVDARTIRRQAEALEQRGVIQRKPKGRTTLLSVPDDADASPQRDLFNLQPKLTMKTKTRKEEGGPDDVDAPTQAS